MRLTRLTPPKQNYGTDVLLSVLKRFGFSPRYIVDIGANRGNWTRTALQYFPAAEYFLVEPQDHLRSHVQDLILSGFRIHWINAGVTERTGTLSFYLSSRDDSSTFLPPNGSEATKRLNEIKVNSKTLDQILAECNIPAPDIVKIDAEGVDLRVLQGAAGLIGKTDVILIEAGVTCPFENSAIRVINTMDALGYHLIDICELNRSPKHDVLWLVELAFLRKESPLLNSATSYE